ncbi:hypothetical protein [Ochrobactrum sp. CGA5]|uniref:hypothetical protein n=1 Tax=Ochrobactrum sp. CGA5 TaxID=2583453 RepID=UPI00112446DE|nr:hypothetical protein [Ochrobactrum sp. CGA5]
MAIATLQCTACYLSPGSITIVGNQDKKADSALFYAGDTNQLNHRASNARIGLPVQKTEAGSSQTSPVHRNAVPLSQGFFETTNLSQRETANRSVNIQYFSDFNCQLQKYPTFNIIIY